MMGRKGRRKLAGSLGAGDDGSGCLGALQRWFEAPLAGRCSLSAAVCGDTTPAVDLNKASLPASQSAVNTPNVREKE